MLPLAGTDILTRGGSPVPPEEQRGGQERHHGPVLSMTHGDTARGPCQEELGLRNQEANSSIPGGALRVG